MRSTHDGNDERWTVRERLTAIGETLRSEVAFAWHTYPRSLRDSWPTTRATLRYRTRTRLHQRRLTADHREAFGALGQWSKVWGKLSPSDDDHLDDNMICLLPVPDPSSFGDLTDEVSRGFLTTVLSSMVAPDERLLVVTRSFSYADGTPPKPLRQLSFLKQAYWGSVSNPLDDPGECLLAHLFVSWITIADQNFSQLCRVVVDDAAAGVCILPQDLRWSAWLVEIGLDVRATRQVDLVAFEEAARAAGGHSVRRGAEPPPFGAKVQE